MGPWLYSERLFSTARRTHLPYAQWLVLSTAIEYNCTSWKHDRSTRDEQDLRKIDFKDTINGDSQLSLVNTTNNIQTVWFNDCKESTTTANDYGSKVINNIAGLKPISCFRVCVLFGSGRCSALFIVGCLPVVGQESFGRFFRKACSQFICLGRACRFQLISFNFDGNQSLAKPILPRQFVRTVSPSLWWRTTLLHGM